MKHIRRIYEKGGAGSQVIIYQLELNKQESNQITEHGAFVITLA